MLCSKMMTLACSTAAIAITCPASAQDAATPPTNATETSSASVGIEDIVVTAQRRSENLQDVPIAVTAFSADAISTARIQSFNDLATRIPGFSVNTFSQSRANPALRGGSTSLSAPGAEQAIGLFIDDVYFGGSGDFEIDLFDVERIEVLKGPQGTLFGRNTTGGLINVVTKTPTQELQAQGEVSMGNYDYFQVRGYLAGGLTDTLAGSIAFTSSDRDGTSFNSFTGNRVDTINRSSVRGKLAWAPSDSVNIVLGAGYSRVNETAPARDAIFTGVPIENQALLATGFVPDNDPRVVQMWTDGSYKSEQFTASLHVTKELGDANLLSITSYRNLRTQQSPISLAGVTTPVYDFGEPRELDAASQEFRYISDYSGPFNFVGGVFLYYANESRDLNGIAQWEENTVGGYFQSLTLCPLQNPDELVVSQACKDNYASLFEPSNFRVFQRTKTKSASAFLQGNYELTDSLKLTLGGRYTYDKKSATGFSSGDLEFFWHPADILVDDSESWGQFTYRAAVDWKVTDDILLYASRSTGFRSGAYELTQSDPALSAVPVGPEKVLSHEVGFKSRLFNDMIQFNVAVFHAKYTDLQFFVNTGDASVTTNAGQATVKGIEIDAVVAPVRGVTLSAAYSYQKGSSKGIPVQAEIADGTPPAGTIPHTIVLGADFEHEFANGSAVFLHGDFTHKSRYGLEFNDTPQFRSGVKSMINGSIGYRFANKMELRIWGKNLTNENVVTYGQNFWFAFYSLPTALANPDVITKTAQPRYADPRTFGATLSFKF
ncbi:TonB-dependent receptor [Sphingobium sp. SA2]|uniref:TonB-dependent receptor n=1 Tax=Sphingobium sp. SA2 TaxID=1524832 RepID=UPI0028C05651|nr:TonB-dependent receptor [Sphingobium sp. SA2]MDT7532024.1 TonB-dependent receptor [Sphingobium sp. SA2]